MKQTEALSPAPATNEEPAWHTDPALANETVCGVIARADYSALTEMGDAHVAWRLRRLSRDYPESALHVERMLLSAMRVCFASLCRREEKQPVTSCDASANPKEWVRPPKPGKFICGLTRRYLYQLMDAGKIRSITIIQEGNVRGVRLIHLPSIHAFLKSLDQSQNRKGAA